jgi:hypothetical protein
MSFFHPLALLIGGALIGLPVAVHLLTRPRPVRFPFSALRFLDTALRQRRFFARLRDAVVLTLRTLALVAIAAAFARPLLHGALLPAGGNVNRRVVILDVSGSMNARKGGVGVFQRARAKALQYVRYSPDLGANLILAGARPKAAFDLFSANFPAMQAEIRAAEAREENLDAPAALARAAQMFSNPQDPARGKGQLVIVTDLQATSWREVGRGDLPPDVEIIVEYVGLGLGPEVGNLAVTSVSTVGRPEVGRPTPVRVEMQNFSGADQTRTVELAANDRVYRQDVACKAWSRAVAAFELPGDATAENGGWIIGTAQLVEARDALPFDDVRPFAFEVRKAAFYAVVSRESGQEVGSSTYFVARMLCPTAGMANAGGERVVAFRPGAATADALTEADMIVLNQPGRLEPEWIQFLAGMLLRGRPVLYVLSEPADAENLAALAQACGHALSLPVSFTAWQGAAASGRSYRFDASGGAPLTLTDVRTTVWPFQAFGEDVPTLAKGLTAGRVLKTAPEPHGAENEVLAKWSDGSAALVSTRVGNGQLVLWNADMLSSTLPRSGFFVAVMREIVGQLLTDPLTHAGWLPCGAGRMLLLPPAAGCAEGLALLGPDGKRIEEFDLREEKNGLTWRWTSVGRPGVYRVERNGKTVFAVAAACPPEESDLRPIAPGGLEAQLAPKTSVHGRQPSVAIVGLPGQAALKEAAEVWPWLLVAALAFILSELAVLKMFRV